MPRELVPQQRMGNEDELAGTVLYLASKVRQLGLCPSYANDKCRPAASATEA
jgi:hypothetical protein